MSTGKPNVIHQGKNNYKMTVDSNNVVSINGMSKVSSNLGKFEKDKLHWNFVGTDKIDYELHLGAKLSYHMYFNAKQLRHSEMTLLQNQCELERTQILTIMMLAVQNNRLAGYMLTGNRSMFLDTDGSIGWLYHCPKKLSPLKVLDRCFDRIPIFYEDRTMFVDPITRQTFPIANEIKCSGGYQNAFQLDVDDEKSWYQLMPAPMPFSSPAIMSPHDIGHITQFPTYDTRRAGMYTPKQIKQFWSNIIQNTVSNDILKKITRTVMTKENINFDDQKGYDFASSVNFNREVYLDSLLSPTFFVNQFIGTFGKIAYWVERCGAYFASFLLVKFLIDILVTILRALEIHRLSKQTTGFWKILLGATYNLFVLSIFTSVFSPNENEEQKERAAEHGVELKGVESPKYNFCTQAENAQPLPEEPPRNKHYPVIAPV